MEENMEKELVTLLRKLNLTISFGESCTGGLLASTLVNVSGASNVFNESYVTYSEEAKMRILGVKKETLDKYSVYSEEVAIEMVKGVYNLSKANIAVSITGRAGGEVKEEQDGSCYFAILLHIGEKETLYTEHFITSGLRNEVRKNQVEHIFEVIINLLK